MSCKHRADPTQYDISPQDEERLRKVDAIFRHLLGGCSEREFTKLRCPVCGSALTLHVHPNLHTFAVSCTASTLHFMRHDSISEAPIWWRTRIGGGWYDDGGSQPAGAQLQRGADESQQSSSLTNRTSAAAGSRGSR
jgi:hypothetical protein